MEPFLKLENISKAFGPVTVLQDINLEFEAGMVYAFAGENGAGKSTLCNIISGNLKPNSGTIYHNGYPIKHYSIMQAKEIGIKMVHQELQLLPLLNITDNIFVGEERAKFGFLSKKDMKKKAYEILKMVGLDLPLDTFVEDIEISGKQLIEIARAINGEVKLIILDEPTSSLTRAEIDKLFEIVEGLKKKGISFIFISHRLDEVLRFSDKIIVLKDGRQVGKLDASKTNSAEIIKLMVGRSFNDFYNRKRLFTGHELLRVENLTTIPTRKGSAYIPKNINFTLYEGEVLGIAGLVGSGRTELVRTLFGDLGKQSGDIYINGEKTTIKNSYDAIKLGMAWVTEDRKQEGLILEHSIKQNISITKIREYAKYSWINDKALTDLTNQYIETLRIKAIGPEQEVKFLSGGNQQKVVLAKWLATAPKILVLDEPTRGIDVGAKSEIYKLINELTSKGIGVLFISSELLELIGMSDRLITIYEGEITGEFLRHEFDERFIMHSMISQTGSKEKGNE